MDQLACLGEGSLSTNYFNILCNFLADTLEEVFANDTSTRVIVNEVFENDTHLFYSSQVAEGKFLGVKKNRSNFMSQFYVSSMGVVIANFAEVSACYFCIAKVKAQRDCMIPFYRTIVNRGY